MTADEIKALRQQLKCTDSELAAALDVDRKRVTAWERGDLFPTKRHVTQLLALGDQGPEAIAHAVRRRAVEATVNELRTDPELWRVTQKLVVHSQLRAEVTALAAGYDDPE